MSTYAFAQEWPGRRARRHRKHHHHHHHHAMAAIAEMRGGRKGEGPGDWGPGFGHGPFGRGGFGPGGFGPGPRGRGRARRGDVRLALLRLLAEQPANGYQLMQAIEERSEGQWRPSPGSVYPRLSQLEDEGLIQSVGEEGNRQLEITEAGRAHLETRAEEPDPWQTPDGEQPLGNIRHAIGAIAQAAAQVARVGDEAQQAKAAELLTQTRRELYRLLAEEDQD